MDDDPYHFWTSGCGTRTESRSGKRRLITDFPAHCSPWSTLLSVEKCAGMLVSMSIALPPPEVFGGNVLRSGRTAMAEKHYKPEEIVASLRQVDVLISQGQNVVDAIRQIGLSEMTYYRWRREFGGLNTEQVKRLKSLELENARLRKAVSELTLDKLILQQ